MPFDILKIMKNRRTAFEFGKTEIKQYYINKVLEAGRWAPSAKNSQPWSFILVKNEKMLGSIMEASLYGDFRMNPKVGIVLVIEPYEKQFKSKPSLRKFDETHKYMNIAFPASNMLLAAESLGLASNIISITKPNEVREMLNIPKKSEPVLMIGLGSRTKGSYIDKPSRKDMEEILHLDVY